MENPVVENPLAENQPEYNKRQNKEKNTNYSIEKIVESTQTDIRHPFGQFHNVYLSENEYNALKREIPRLDGLIEQMSSWLKDNNKKYDDCASKLREWNNRQEKRRSRTGKSHPTQAVSQMTDEEKLAHTRRLIKHLRGTNENNGREDKHSSSELGEKESV